MTFRVRNGKRCISTVAVFATRKLWLSKPIFFLVHSEEISSTFSASFGLVTGYQTWQCNMNARKTVVDFSLWYRIWSAVILRSLKRLGALQKLQFNLNHIVYCTSRRNRLCTEASFMQLIFYFCLWLLTFLKFCKQFYRRATPIKSMRAQPYGYCSSLSERP